MSKYRVEGKLVIGPPLFVAIACDLVGVALLLAAFFLDGPTGQKILAGVVGVVLLLASSGLMIWQLKRHGRRVPNRRW